jgi:hypothetical protein
MQIANDLGLVVFVLGGTKHFIARAKYLAVAGTPSATQTRTIIVENKIGKNGPGGGGRTHTVPGTTGF